MIDKSLCYFFDWLAKKRFHKLLTTPLSFKLPSKIFSVCLRKSTTFWLWKSTFSCVEISFGVFPISPKLFSLCQRKSRDTSTYLKYIFRTTTSYCEPQTVISLALMKSEQNERKSKILKIFSFFYFEKVHFPASKSHPKCFLYPQNYSNCVNESLEILLHTHKVFFGCLDCILETFEKRLHFGHIGHF